MGTTTGTQRTTSPLSSKQADPAKPVKQVAAATSTGAISPEEKKAQKKAAKQAEREAKKAEREKLKAEKAPRKPFRAEDAPKVKGIPGVTEGIPAVDLELTMPPRRADFESEADFYEWKALQAEASVKLFRDKAEEARLTGGAAKGGSIKKLEKMAKEIEALKAKVKTDNPDMDLDAFLASIKGEQK